MNEDLTPSYQLNFFKRIKVLFKSVFVRNRNAYIPPPENLEIRDLIYLDFDKASSIYSQLRGGLLQETQDTKSVERGLSGKITTGNVGLLSAELGGGATNTGTVLERSVLHHDLLTYIEKDLREKVLVFDVNPLRDAETIDEIRDTLSKWGYIRAEGRAWFQHFEGISNAIDTIKKLTSAYGENVAETIKTSTEYVEAQQSIKEQVSLLKTEKNSQRKALLQRAIQDAKRELDNFDKELANLQVNIIPPSLEKLINTYLDTITPGHIHLRLYPFEKFPEFYILAKLKTQCFVDGGIDYTLFSYGSQPNVELTILGLLTSLPDIKTAGAASSTVEVQNPDISGSVSEDEDAIKTMDRAFQQVFDQLAKSIESFGRFSWYPNATIYPIAIYRSIRSSK